LTDPYSLPEVAARVTTMMAATEAVTAGMFALAGVIVGGLLSGGIAAFAGYWRKRTELRAAARLLAGELRGIRGVLKMVAATSDYVPRGYAAPEWDRWREHLARSGNRRLWTSVSAAYSTSENALAGSGSTSQLGHSERAIAFLADELVANAVHRLDRRDGWLQARVRRREDDRIFEAIASRPALADPDADPSDH
jgi:hypothetical protein